MGSTRQRENDPLQQEQASAFQPVGQSLDPNALKAYEDYVKNLSSLQLYTSKFTFKHHSAYGLTEDDFHQVMDDHHVSRSQCYGAGAESIYVICEEEGRVKKSIVIFERSEDNLYDVLVAEVSMESKLSRER